MNDPILIQMCVEEHNDIVDEWNKLPAVDRIYWRGELATRLYHLYTRLGSMPWEAGDSFSIKVFNAIGRSWKQIRLSSNDLPAISLPLVRIE